MTKEADLKDSALAKNGSLGMFLFWMSEWGYPGTFVPQLSEDSFI